MTTNIFYIPGLNRRSQDRRDLAHEQSSRGAVRTSEADARGQDMARRRADEAAEPRNRDPTVQREADCQESTA